MTAPSPAELLLVGQVLDVTTTAVDARVHRWGRYTVRRAERSNRLAATSARTAATARATGAQPGQAESNRP